MLTVRAIKKFHDEKGQLLGYRIKDEVTGQEMDVHKNNLKQAIINKQCEVVNMTLTSDGRLIGKAAPTPKAKKKPEKETGSGVVLLEVYTNGKNIVGGLVDETKFHADINIIHPTQYKGLGLHQNFEVGHELTNNIKQNHYDNVKIIDGKPDMSSVKRKSFSKVKDKMIKMLKDNGISFDLKVEKSTGKYDYSIIILGYDRFEDLDPMVQAIYCLVEDACITSKIKVGYIDEDVLHVENMTGITDVRKAIKDLQKAFS